MRSSSIRIPAHPTIEEIENVINGELSDFGRDAATIENRKYGVSENQVPYVYGKRDGEWAWLLIYEWPEADGAANRFVCDVQSRGDDRFAAIICYAIGKAFGEKIEDDAGFLEAGRDFTVNEFGEMLKRRL